MKRLRKKQKGLLKSIIDMLNQKSFKAKDGEQIKSETNKSKSCPFFMRCPYTPLDQNFEFFDVRLQNLMRIFFFKSFQYQEIFIDT